MWTLRILVYSSIKWWQLMILPPYYKELQVSTSCAGGCFNGLQASILFQAGQQYLKISVTYIGILHENSIEKWIFFINRCLKITKSGDPQDSEFLFPICISGVGREGKREGREVEEEGWLEPWWWGGEEGRVTVTFQCCQAWFGTRAFWLISDSF